MNRITKKAKINQLKHFSKVNPAKYEVFFENGNTNFYELKKAYYENTGVISYRWPYKDKTIYKFSFTPQEINALRVVAILHFQAVKKVLIAEDPSNSDWLAIYAYVKASITDFKKNKFIPHYIVSSYITWCNNALSYDSVYNIHNIKRKGLTRILNIIKLISRKLTNCEWSKTYILK